MKRILFMLATVSCLSFALGACGKKDEEKKGDEAPAAKTNEGDKAAEGDTKPAEGDDKAAEGEGGDVAKIGVAECDEYVEKMMSCLDNDKFPAAAKEQTKKAFDQVVEQWKGMPEAAKANLGQACKAAMDAAKKSYEAMGCTF